MMKGVNDNSVRQLSEELLDLYSGLLIPYMEVRRDIPFPAEPKRNETDGEHAFTLAMLAVTLAERLRLGLNAGLVAQYALVHDLVEAHAGDTTARSTDEEQLIKITREREAMLVIKKQYMHTAPWIPRLIERYDKKQDEEAKFVYACDKLMGTFAWLAGSISEWRHSYPELDGSHFHKVVARLRKKAEIYPPLLPLFDELHEQLDKSWPSYISKN